jgi:hypothetical protein
MTMIKCLHVGVVATFLTIAFACSDNSNQPCTPGDNTTCKDKGDGYVCEQITDGTTGCFAPLTVQGEVIDGQTNAPIAGARVLARDQNNVAVSPIATTAADGTYSLQVPATRDANGVVQSMKVTLRADAQGYQSFPGGIRIALPFDLNTASGDPPVLQSPPTTIALFATGQSGNGWVSGTVDSTKAPGTVVDIGGATGIADRDGSFVVFNVPPGNVTVNGYVGGVNLTPAQATVTADTETTGVVLSEAGPANGSVTGTLNIVNGGGASTTSVVLVIDDTFDTTLERGDVPVGMRAGNVTNNYTIDGVPDGKYAVIPAYENDGLVRDPDTSIAGTQIQHITVAGGVTTVTVFKVTGALAVISPGANDPEVVTGAPTFSWQDDSSETGYHLQVFDTFGNVVWDQPSLPSSQGSNPSVPYTGPALSSGSWYQFRVTSLKNTTPIAKTEDLRGIFIEQ